MNSAICLSLEITSKEIQSDMATNSHEKKSQPPESRMVNTSFPSSSFTINARAVMMRTPHRDIVAMLTAAAWSSSFFFASALVTHRCYMANDDSTTQSSSGSPRS